MTLPQALNPYSEASPEVVLTSDEALAYVLAGQGLFVVDTAVGTLIRWVEMPFACLSGMTISPDGGRLNVIADCDSTDSAIWAIDPVTLVVGEKNVTLTGFSQGSLKGSVARTGGLRRPRIGRLPWPSNPSANART